jgi:hypothetical protein
MIHTKYSVAQGSSWKFWFESERTLMEAFNDGCFIGQLLFSAFNSFPNKKSFISEDLLVFISEYLLPIKHYIIILLHGTSSVSQVIPVAPCMLTTRRWK